MRRVKVFEMWRPEGSDYTVLYKKITLGEGDFHQFGCDYEELELGPGGYSTAIVEMDDGTVKNVPVELIQFIDEGN